MRRAFIALGLVYASALSCDEISNCNLCSSTRGNFLGNCRWCSVDDQCHTPGSMFNPCTSAQNVATADCSSPAPKTKFSKEEALAMTKYSRAAYAETAEVEGCTAIGKTFLSSTFTCMKSFVFQISYANKSFPVLSYYGYDNVANRIILAFRGSINEQAVWEALVTVLEKPLPYPPAPEAMTNPFFLTGALGLTKEMGADYNWLKTLLLQHPSAEVFVTGHSLGGAMASLVATELALKKIVTPVLYTFGQPRTGNGQYAALVNKLLPRSFRVVNSNDPVPHMPFCTSTCDSCNYGSKCGGDYHCCSLSGSNVHHSTEMWFPSGEYQNNVMCGFKECLGTPLGEDPSCSNRYSLGETVMTSHSGYWNALSGYCQAAPLNAQPSYSVENPQNSGIPVLTLVGVCAVIFLVVVFVGLVCLRARAQKAGRNDEFHLLESFSVSS